MPPTKQKAPPPSPVEREIKRHRNLIERLQEDIAKETEAHRLSIQKLKDRIANHQSILDRLGFIPAKGQGK
jgi:hypothetical protein